MAILRGVQYYPSCTQRYVRDDQGPLQLHPGLAGKMKVPFFFQEHHQQQLTPEQLKAMKGPSRDDPVEAEGSASWVQQFNDELAAPSRNALDCELTQACPFCPSSLTLVCTGWLDEKLADLKSFPTAGGNPVH